MHRALPFLALAGLLTARGPAPLAAQNGSADSVLTRPVTLALRNAPLADALTRLRHDQGMPLAWSGDLLPADHRVTAVFDATALGEALDAILAGSGLRVALTREGTVVIVRAPPGTPADHGIAADLLDPALDRTLLATGIRQLDQIVVIGTAVGGAPEREQPTAVTVVNRTELSKAPHKRMSDLVRTLLPGIVLWDRGPVGRPPQVASVRGVSSFSRRGLKTYVDGIELASPDLFTLVDGRSLEQAEVLRGPQGAALYGPDALNGVLQLRTRHGVPGQSAIRGRLSASLGPYDRSDLPTSPLWQDYAGGVSGGTASAGFDLGGSYTRLGFADDVPWQSAWTGNAGTRLLTGPLSLEASARMGRWEYREERASFNGGEPNPITRFPQELEERGVGVTAVHRLTDRWFHTVIAGHHWISGPRERARPSLLTPVLPLGATHETARRTSVHYSTAVDIGGRGADATLSAGVEHSRRQVERAIQQNVELRDLTVLYQDDLTSTGGFGQARVRLGDHLVLSGGSRAEWLSSVGAHQGASWASSAGASWSQPVGRATVRLRGAWGLGLRPPEPGMSRAMATTTIAQLPNEMLSAETQSGIELGAELHLPAGSTFRVTWYDQAADDLISQVPIRVKDVAVKQYQFQNVGAISNRGVEFEASLPLGPLAFTGMAYFTTSEITRLATTYTGDLEPGDPVPEVPEAVGSAALRYAVGGFSAELGASWLGKWIGFDYRAVVAAAAGQTPVRLSDREYWVEYPSVLRPWIAASWRTGRWSAFVRIDNPANDPAVVRDNFAPPLGRVAAAGFEILP